MTSISSTQPDLINPRLSEDEKLALVNREWQRLLEHFDRKAARGKNNFYLYKYSSIVLAALTTIVSTLQGIYSAEFPLWILPIISSAATVAVAFLGASSAQRIWIHSKTTGQQLQMESFLFNQQAGQYHKMPSEESIRLFSERLMQIWNEGHGKWEQTVGDD